MLGWIETYGLPSNMVVPICSPTSDMCEYQLLHILTYVQYYQHFSCRALHLDPLFLDPCIWLFFEAELEKVALINLRGKKAIQTLFWGCQQLMSLLALISYKTNSIHSSSLVFPDVSWKSHSFTCTHVHFRPTPGIPSQKARYALENFWLKVLT